MDVFRTEGGSRTRKDRSPEDFESSASANFTTSAMQARKFQIN